MARRTLRPMRPKPFMATLTVILGSSPFSLALTFRAFYAKRYAAVNVGGEGTGEPLAPEGHPLDQIGQFAGKEQGIRPIEQHGINAKRPQNEEAQNDRRRIRHVG